MEKFLAEISYYFLKKSIIFESKDNKINKEHNGQSGQ